MRTQFISKLIGMILGHAPWRASAASPGMEENTAKTKSSLRVTNVSMVFVAMRSGDLTTSIASTSQKEVGTSCQNLLLKNLNLSK